MERLQKMKEWNDKYEQESTKIIQQFANETSRVKLKSLYPDIEQQRTNG